MIRTLDGIQTLEHIKNQPGTVINNYYIHAKGFFDKEGYDKWLSDNFFEDKPVEDCTIFFRACPFVKKGSGCTLPPRFRTIVCNFFICNDVIGRADIQGAFKPYIEERSRYAAWVEWENQTLEHLLREKGVDLARNYEASISILQDTPLDVYEFPMLEPINMDDTWNDTWNKGA